MLIEMLDGGIVNYEDDCYCYEGCPNCGAKMDGGDGNAESVD